MSCPDAEGAAIRPRDGGSGHASPRRRCNRYTTATTVRIRGRQTRNHGWPFAETKEQLAGFCTMIEAHDLDQAIELASRIPPARVGSIEIRPATPIRETVAAAEALGRRNASKRNREFDGLRDTARQTGGAACRHASGRLAHQADRTKPLAGRRPALSRPHHQSPGARSAPGPYSPRPAGHLGPTILLPRPRQDLARAARPPASGRQSMGRRARSGYTLWLAPGPDDERDAWVRRHLAARAVLPRRTAARTGHRSRSSTTTHSTASGWARCRTARRRTQAASIIDPRDARHIYFAMSGGGVPSPSMAATVLRPGRQHGGRQASTPRRSPSTIRIACACAQATPTVSTSRTTAASTGSTGLAPLAAHRPGYAGRGRRHRLSDGAAPAQRRHRLGLSGWTAPTGWPQHQPGGKAAVLHPRRR